MRLINYIPLKSLLSQLYRLFSKKKKKKQNTREIPGVLALKFGSGIFLCFTSIVGFSWRIHLQTGKINMHFFYVFQRTMITRDYNGRVGRFVVYDSDTAD